MVGYVVAISLYAALGSPELFMLSYDAAFRHPDFVYFHAVVTVKFLTANVLLCVVAFRIRLIKDETGIKKLLKRNAVVAWTAFWCLSFARTLAPMDFNYEITALVLGDDIAFVL